MPTKERLTEDHPRWGVRYVYLADVWPEASTYPDPEQAVLAAPADACLRAITRDARTYGELLNAERAEHACTKAELAELRAALALLGAALGVRPDA